MKYFNKKGLSEIIGHILLISFALIMSFIVYQGLITYVPVSKTSCPDGVSIFVKNYSCVSQGAGYILDLRIKNNGKFDIAGFFIYATDKANQTIATIPLANNLSSENAEKIGNAVMLSQVSENAMKLDEEILTRYNLSKKIYSLDITPARYQREDKKLRLVVCGNSKISETIECGA